MNMNRAHEIINSDEKINVTLDGVSVWIDSIDTNKETAKVHVETIPSDKRVVPVAQLQEV